MDTQALGGATDEADGASTGSERGKADRPSSRFVVGPGFEIAVRTGEGKPFDMTVDGSRRGPGRGAPRKETQGSGELERRVTAVEALLLALVQQLDEVEAKVDAALAEARKRPDVP